jgi:haloacid dehalogenase superfamily, subfamily IA, variant 1 with third motif having Dx(3-4)D or Dx(3-4)E
MTYFYSHLLFIDIIGKIAQLYQEMGGSCEYFGKPHAQHFKACLRELGLEASKVAHVGDSLHHDIAGANDAGISSVFITGGIHSNELDASVGVIPSESALKDLFEREGHVPTFVAPLLKF